MTQQRPARGTLRVELLPPTRPLPAHGPSIHLPFRSFQSRMISNISVSSLQSARQPPWLLSSGYDPIRHLGHQGVPARPIQLLCRSSHPEFGLNFQDLKTFLHLEWRDINQLNRQLNLCFLFNLLLNVYIYKLKAPHSEINSFGSQANLLIPSSSIRFCEKP